MGLDNVQIGAKAPEEVNVIIEIAAMQAPVKYEVDKDSHVLHVDRFLSTSMQYPCNYGYVPNTLCGDGDPSDVLVLSPFSLMPGSVITVRPIGVMIMSDEAGKDNKILAVPVSKITKEYDHIKNVADLPAGVLDRISHFFERYKDLEFGKWVKLDQWLDAKAAVADLTEAMNRYNDSCK